MANVRSINGIAFECPRCRGKDFEIVKDEVDIGVGVQTRVLGGLCGTCGNISLCDMCGGWDGRHEVWCKLVPSKEWTVAEPIDLGEQVPPWSKYKKEMKSRLVVACNGNGGCVLHAIGSCWEAWHEGSGSYRLDDNGLDNAPDGISIWEGRMHSWGPDRDGEYDAELRGEFRDLTENEWKLLAKGEAPWDEKEWLIGPELT